MNIQSQNIDHVKPEYFYNMLKKLRYSDSDLWSTWQTVRSRIFHQYGVRKMLDLETANLIYKDIAYKDMP